MREGYRNGDKWCWRWWGRRGGGRYGRPLNGVGVTRGSLGDPVSACQGEVESGGPKGVAARWDRWDRWARRRRWRGEWGGFANNCCGWSVVEGKFG